MNVSHNPLLLQPEQKLTPNIPVTVECHLPCCSYLGLLEHLIFINLHIHMVFSSHLPPGVTLPSWRQLTLPEWTNWDISWVKPAVITHSSRAHTYNGLLKQLSGCKLLVKEICYPNGLLVPLTVRNSIVPKRKNAKKQRALLTSVSLLFALTDWKYWQHLTHTHREGAAVAAAGPIQTEIADPFQIPALTPHKIKKPLQTICRAKPSKRSITGKGARCLRLEN